LFVGEVVATHVGEDMLTNGILDVLKAQPISHKGGFYFIPNVILKHER
jgi:flavin reductase (DIM6/NTAB) family NADH-FMN oxidoreductase RutF